MQYLPQGLNLNTAKLKDQTKTFYSFKAFYSNGISQLSFISFRETSGYYECGALRKKGFLIFYIYKVTNELICREKPYGRPLADNVDNIKNLIKGMFEDFLAL